MCVKNNVVALIAVAAAVMVSFAAEAEDYEINIASGDTVTLSSASDTHVIGLLAGGVMDRRLYKTGAGRLIINYDFKGAGYAGEIRVHEGYLRVQHDGALGTTAAGTFVDDGATFECDCSIVGAAKLSFSKENLTFVGYGADGTGCVKMVGSSSYAFFSGGTKTMLGDSLWNGESGRMDVRFGTFDMGGHTLYTTNTVAFTGCTVTNPGNIRALSNFTIDTDVELSGNSDNEIIIDGAGILSLQSASKPIKWALDVNNNLDIRPQQNHKASITNMASAVGINVINGPIYLNNSSRLRVTCNYVNPSIGPITDSFDPYHHLVTLGGEISGAGGQLSVSGTSGQLGFCRLLCPENSFSGGVTVGDGAILEAATVGSLGTGPLTLYAGSTLRFLYGLAPQEYTLDDDRYAQIFAFNAAICGSDGFYSSHPNVGFQNVPDYTFNGNNAYAGDIYHLEGNELTLDSTITNGRKLKNVAGTLVVDGSGSHNLLGNLIVNDGTLKIANGAVVHLGDHYASVAGAYPACPRLFVGTNAVLCCRGDNPSTSLPFNYIGGGNSTGAKADFARGILEISPGALVTNQFCLTASESSKGTTNSMGAVYMRGGTVVQHSSNSRTANMIGSVGEGYFELEDGFLDASKESEWFQIGRRPSAVEPASRGVLCMKGGKLEHHSVGFVVNNGGGFGLLRQSGGFVTNNHVMVGATLWVDTGRDHNEGTVTLEGTARMNLRDGIWLGGISNSVSVLNLNGGLLEASNINAPVNRTEMPGGGSQALPFDGCSHPSYVNFNGGEYRTLLGNRWSGWLDTRVTRFTVYAGGATVDIGASNRQLEVPFRAPSGKGVASVSFSCSEPWKYIGAPYVRIIDPTGAGYGATAAADFDSHTGVITGVTVTSPGCDYGEGTYAEISFGGSTAIVNAAVTLATTPNTGDFVKKGTGLLSINTAPIEVGGWLRLREGSVEVVSAGPASAVLPNLAGIELASGTTLSMGVDATMPAVAYAGCGTIWGNPGLVIASTLTADGTDLAAGRWLRFRKNHATSTVDIASGTKLVVTDPELLTGNAYTVLASDVAVGGAELEFADPELAAEWHFRRSVADGVQLIRIARTRPLSLLLR